MKDFQFFGFMLMFHSFSSIFNILTGRINQALLFKIFFPELKYAPFILK